MREAAGRKATLSLYNGLMGKFYWEVRVTELDERETQVRRVVSAAQFSSPAQAAADGLKALNDLALA